MDPFLKKMKFIYENKKIIVCLPEFTDSRILQAANQLVADSKNIEIVFIEIFENLLSLFHQHGCHALLQHLGTRVHLKGSTVSTHDILQTLATIRPHAALPELSQKQATYPLYAAAHLLTRGEVDVVLAGAVHTTADVIRAGLMGVGKQTQSTRLSGAFVMTRFQNDTPMQFVFTDCGVAADPNEDSLVQSAYQAARLRSALFEDEARVAFLSFSTHGSADHPSAQKMARSAKMFAEQHPQIPVDGELQFDAAIDLAVGQRKAPGSPVAGRANVFVFPDLNAGNIAYKITQRLGGFSAYGPILLGLQKPYSDLSRGASVADIVASVYINATLISRS